MIIVCRGQHLGGRLRAAEHVRLHAVVAVVSGVHALEDAHLTIRPGEIHGLLGENGSGKTTLAKLLAGLYEPDEGRVLWDGQDVATFRPSSACSAKTLTGTASSGLAPRCRREGGGWGVRPSPSSSA